MVKAACLTITLFWLCTLTALSACEMQTRVVSEPWWNQLPADESPADRGEARTRQAGGTWTIPLERFSGPGRQAQARALITRLQQQANLRDLWSEDVQGTVTVYRGRFADPSTEEARQALLRSRRIILDGEQPFADARLTSLGGDGRPRVTDPHDLRQFPGYYTLQIGYYDPQYDGDFRNAAEQAVRKLREEGHEAYFYHGPHRSLVTVGLFSYDQAFMRTQDVTARQAQVDAYAPQIRELQKAFPHNRPNGGQPSPHNPDHPEQPLSQSFLVRVF